MRSTDIIPPTRTYSTDEIKEALLSRNIESLMIIDVGSSNQSSSVIGYNSYGRAYGSASGSAYSVGNQTYVNVRGSSTSNTSTYAVRRFDRNTVTYSKLFDVSSDEIVWSAQTETKAGGAFFMSNGSTGGSLSSTIIDELVNKGHVVPLNTK